MGAEECKGYSEGGVQCESAVGSHGIEAVWFVKDDAMYEAYILLLQ